MAAVQLALTAVQQYRCSAFTTGTMVSNGELVAYAASSVVGGVCTGATGFGKSILFHTVSLVVFAASGLGDPDLVQGVAILSVMSVCLFALVYSARADFNGVLALLVMGPAALGVLCGTFVLVGSSQGLLKLVFGVRCTTASGAPGGGYVAMLRTHTMPCFTQACLCVFALWRWWWVLSHPPAPRKPSPLAVVPVTPSSAAPAQVCKVAAPQPPAAALGDAGQTASASPPSASDSQVKPAASPRRGLSTRIRDHLRHGYPGHRVAMGAIFAGFCSGFSMGVFGVAGPPIMVFVCVAGLRKGEVRASFALMFAVAGTIQVCCGCTVCRCDVVTSAWGRRQ